MLVKKKKFLCKQIFIKKYFLANELLARIKLSLFNNLETNCKSRLLSGMLAREKTRKYYFTKERLQCLVTSKLKVPNKKLRISRFFLAKHADSLKLTKLTKV